jgi:hypothetical protein
LSFVSGVSKYFTFGIFSKELVSAFLLWLFLHDGDYINTSVWFCQHLRLELYH